MNAFCVALLAQTTRPPVSPVQRMVNSLTGMAQGFFNVLPRLAIGLVTLALFWGAGYLLRGLLRPRLSRLRTPSFGAVFAGLAYAGVVLVGLVVALPIAIPTLTVAGLLGGLGLVSVAAGFAFQDILSNLLAGILLIFRQPFVSGDQIELLGVGGSDDIEGTVEAITIRETRVRTYNGELVVVPNKEVYQNPIQVQTAFESKRSSVEVGVGYEMDLGRARRIALDTLAQIDGVMRDPAPEAYYKELDASAVTLDLRYWTGPRQAEVRRVQDLVVEAICNAFNREGIDMPYDTVTLDAAESFQEALAPLAGAGTDGERSDRTRSREGGSGQATRGTGQEPTRGSSPAQGQSRTGAEGRAFMGEPPQGTDSGGAVRRVVDRLTE